MSDTLNECELFLYRPHLINALLFCERQFFLEYHGFYSQDSTEIQMGAFYHKKYFSNIPEIKVDKIDFKKGIVYEYKKRKIEKNSIIQLYFYMCILNEKYNFNIKEGRLISIERKSKIVIDYPNKRYRRILIESCKRAKDIISLSKPPPRINKAYCRKCSFYTYCWG